MRAEESKLVVVDRDYLRCKVSLVQLGPATVLETVSALFKKCIFSFQHNV